MKQYPSIPHFNKGFYGDTVYAFDKLDGSNMRFEYSKKRGWYKFGTKTQMITNRHEVFGEAVDIFMTKYSDNLQKVFTDRYKKIDNIVVFGEYVGENSFAGRHYNEDTKDVVIFDVNVKNKGFINPDEFMINFGHLHIPTLVYNGEYNDELVQNIRNNIYNLKEGVICKGIRQTKGSEAVWMTKIKTNEWLSKVKQLHGERALIEELNNDKKLIQDYGN